MGSPLARVTGPRLLFFLGTIGTAAMLLWMHQLRLNGEVHGLTRIVYFLFAYNDYSGAVCAIAILGCALLLSPYVPTLRILNWAGDHPVLIAVLTALLFAVGTLFVYQNHPLAMDEYAAYFQSRVFAAGHLNGRFPPQILDWVIPPGFQDYFLNVSRSSGSVAETYWPGFALLLTPFTWAGIPWLCNPVISALTLLVIYKLAVELFDDRRAAALSLLLTIASPVIFANGISYYSMPAHLLANSLFALLLIRPNAVRAFAAGVVGSIALSLHNPVPHILFAAPWLIWIATRRDRASLLCALIAGYLPLCVLLGVGWFAFSAHLLSSGGPVSGTALVTEANRLQDMLSIFSRPHATLLLARVIAAAKVWIWAVPGLLILACVGALRWRRNTLCRLLTASALLTVVGYLFVPVDQGHGWGSRYFHSAWMALPLLATAAMFRPVGTTRIPQGAQQAPSRIFEDLGTKSYVTTCILLTLVFGVGWRAWQIHEFIARDLSRLPHYNGTEPRVEIIQGGYASYSADLVQNDPWLRGPVVRMYSHGAAADAIIIAEYYPNSRLVYSDRNGSVWSQASTPHASPETNPQVSQ
jgi:hypothetical protein